jgi:hypothetical protein
VLLYSHSLDSNWNWLHTRYIAFALTAQKTSYAAAVVAWRLTAAEVSLPLSFVATREAGETPLLFLLLRALPSNER